MMKKTVAFAVAALFSLGAIVSSGSAFAQAVAPATPASPAKPAAPSVKSEKAAKEKAAKEKNEEGNKGLKKGSDQGKKVGHTKKAG